MLRMRNQKDDLISELETSNLSITDVTKLKTHLGTKSQCGPKNIRSIYGGRIS